MINRIKISERDCALVNPSLVLNATTSENDTDYEGLVVKKPWGFEYLFFHNNYVAGWILHINKGNQTSLHCHHNKKTSLIVLKGHGLFSTCDGVNDIKEGESVIMDKGVFHSTRALSDMIVLEMETPPNKKDLYRFSDTYGRAFRGYEGKESHADLGHGDYANIPTLYNFKKNFGLEVTIGNYSLSIHKYKHLKDPGAKKPEALHIIGVLSNSHSNPSTNDSLQLADIILGGDFKKLMSENINGESELILIEKK